MISKKELSKQVNKNIRRYQNLCINNTQVICPYAINFVEPEFLSLMKKCNIEKEKILEVHELYKNNKGEYGWYRGKGTPKEVESAFLEISKLKNLNISNLSADSIREYMKLFGLGVDCSGYIFNILLSSFKALNLEKVFVDSLNWSDNEKKGASRAGVDVFVGNTSTLLENINLLSNLDLLFIKDLEGSYSHIAMILNDGDRYKITQSTVEIIPNGVRVDSMSIVDGRPKFEFLENVKKGWDRLYENNQIEFRRLKVLEN